MVLSMDACGTSDKRLILEILAGLSFLDPPMGHNKVIKGTSPARCRRVP